MSLQCESHAHTYDPTSVTSSRERNREEVPIDGRDSPSTDDRFLRSGHSLDCRRTFHKDLRHEKRRTVLLQHSMEKIDMFSQVSGHFPRHFPRTFSPG